MVVTIILTVLIGAFLIWNIVKMANNVRNGRSIDGCSGDCAHCNGGCAHSTVSLKDRLKDKK